MAELARKENGQLPELKWEMLIGKVGPQAGVAAAIDMTGHQEPLWLTVTWGRDKDMAQ